MMVYRSLASGTRCWVPVLAAVERHWLRWTAVHGNVQQKPLQLRTSAPDDIFISKKEDENPQS